MLVQQGPCGYLLELGGIETQYKKGVKGKNAPRQRGSGKNSDAGTWGVGEINLAVLPVDLNQPGTGQRAYPSDSHYRHRGFLAFSRQSDHQAPVAWN